MWAKIGWWFLKGLMALIAIAGVALVVTLAVDGVDNHSGLLARTLDVFIYLLPFVCFWLVTGAQPLRFGGGASSDGFLRVNTDGTPMIGDSCVDANGNAYGSSSSDNWPRHD
jgi:hypothetical protein